MTITTAVLAHSEGVKHFDAGCNSWIFTKVPKLPSTVSSNSSLPTPKLLPPPPKSAGRHHLHQWRCPNQQPHCPGYRKVREERVITVKGEWTIADEIEITEGMQSDYGYVSPYFVTNVRPQWVKFGKCFILLSEKKISLR